MTLIANPQGCKVGWAFYSTEAEAVERGRVEDEARVRRLAQGYDFGYQWPGSGTIKHHPNHPEYGECWSLVTT